MTEALNLGAKPWARDLGRHFDALSEWVSATLGAEGPARLVDLRPTDESANGFAGESFVTEIAFKQASGDWAPKTFLLKRKPTTHQYFPDRDFESEIRTQELLWRSGHAPVAPFVGCEFDDGVIDAPFYLLGFVEGRPTPDQPSLYLEGWLAESPADVQRSVCQSGLEALAQLHSKSLTELGAEFLNRTEAPASQLDWDLAHWGRFFDISWRGEPLPLIVEVKEWLGENRIPPLDLVISWGDARPGNIMFKDGRCRAIIDWDMVSSGDPEKDLGYWLAMDLQFERVAEMIGGGSRLTGWPTRKAMVALYEEALGRSVDQKRLRYYRIFAAFLIACMYARYQNMRSDLDEETRAQYLSEQMPPIALAREEIEAVHLAGDAT